MRIVGALDVHRRQITYAIVDVRSGGLSRGRVTPATRESVREWLARFDSRHDVHFALEGTTGWRFVAEEIVRAGHRAHLADPAETAAKRGRKRRAKTDRADCDLLLRLLAARELPESWIPPAQILELRTRVRLRKTLVDERTAWQQRLQAHLFHQGERLHTRPQRRPHRLNTYKKARFPRLLQSPLTDSNRRPPPYHGGLGEVPACTRGHSRARLACKSDVSRVTGVPARDRACSR